MRVEIYKVSIATNRKVLHPSEVPPGSTLPVVLCVRYGYKMDFFTLLLICQTCTKQNIFDHYLFGNYFDQNIYTEDIIYIYIKIYIYI